jgi:predicted RNase H-like HicB family nuclease
MSTKSKRSSGNGKRASSPTEPFSAAILHKAQEIARDYRITIEKSDSLGYIGTSIEIPTVFADGKTPGDCYEATQQALTVAVATMLEAGQKPPQPAAAMKRTTQVNVRLTYEEKSMITAAAANSGFKGLADFIRTTVLDRILFSR